MILEVDLNYLIAEPEHDGMLCAHPLLHVHGARRMLLFVSLIQFIPLSQLLFFLWVIVLFEV